MSVSTKILQFRRPEHPAALHFVPSEAESFPRFREEWNRPSSPAIAPHLERPVSPPSQDNSR